MSGFVRIWSSDGGGVRGTLPALFGDWCEKQANQPIAKTFDVMAGTSTSSIIVGAYNRPNDERQPFYTAAQVSSIFTDSVGEVFSQTLCHEIKSVDGLASPKYLPDHLEHVLTKYIGDYHLSETITTVTIPASDLDRVDAFSFSTNNPVTRDIKVREAIRASTAAPTFFPAYEVKGLVYSENEQTYRYPSDIENAGTFFVDGGLYANNPAAQAYNTAKKIHGCTSQILLLSVGTGGVKNYSIPPAARNWGAVHWSVNILEAMFALSSASVDLDFRTTFDGTPVSPTSHTYCRIQFDIDWEHMSLDKATPENMAYLKDVYDKFMEAEKNQDMLYALGRMLRDKEDQ